MPTKQLISAVEVLQSWLPNYDFKNFPTTLAEILVDLPGGERLEDIGMGEGRDATIGWKELDMLGNLLDAIEGKEDVEYAVDELFGPEDEEEEEGEEEEEPEEDEASEEAPHVTQKLRDAVGELQDWLPNYDWEGFPKRLAEILVDLPGGEALEDMGVGEGRDAMIGWQELTMLGDLLMAIEGKEDVEYAVDELFFKDQEGEEEEQEEEEEEAEN